jgi:hypothetical protein
MNPTVDVGGGVMQYLLPTPVLGWAVEKIGAEFESVLNPAVTMRK